MKNKQFYFLLTTVVLFVFITSLFTTVNVLADDSTPPAPTEEPVLPPTEEPVVTEESVPAAEDVNVSEIMTQAPEGTDLVVLDQNGDVLPLVSSEAADVLASADPYYWDGTNYIGFSASGICPPIVTVCNTNANPIQAAVDDFAANSTATGNIYVEAGTYTENVVVDGSLSIYLANLTGIIGDGSGSTTLEGSFKIYNMNGFTLSGFNVVDNGSGGGYVYASDNTGTFTLNDLIVSNSNGNGPTGNGIDVIAHDGDINLTNVISNDNYNSGAVLENCGRCGALDDITITSSTFDNNGMAWEQSTARGLRAWSNGNITLTDVAADWNAGGGAELINCFFDFIGFSGCQNTNPDDVTITINGTNTFNNNGYIPDQFLGGPYASVGLWVGSRDGATISGVTASQNGVGDIAGGALFFAENGNLSISNSIFNENCMDCGLGFGFIALNLGGDITLNGVTANETGNQAFPYEGVGGMILNLSGNTFVNNSDFSNNCTIDDCSGAGLFILSAAGDVTLDHVTSNGNGTDLGGGVGAVISPAGNIDITCSTFNDNFGDGLDANISGTMTLNGVTMDGNKIKPLDFAGATLVQNPFNCNPVSGPDGSKKPLPSRPIAIIPVTGDFDCATFGGTLLILPNGDNALFPCPIQDEGKIEVVSIDKLPGSLPEGSDFISSFTTFLFKDGKAQDSSEESITISFIIPEGADTETLSILFWDGTEWTDLGGAVSEDGLHFQVPTKLIGTFVLVSK